MNEDNKTNEVTPSHGCREENASRHRDINISNHNFGKTSILCTVLRL